MKRKSTLLMIVAFLMACSQNKVSVTYFNDADVFKETLNSVILGKVLKVAKKSSERSELCADHPCFASVKVLNLVQNGQNYHGQYQIGDTIEVYFNFTLDETTGFIPSLNKALPGLKKNDLFQAELFESTNREKDFRVQLYVKKENE